MFERFTEIARRIIFFARYEASVSGTPQIEVDHLLLGLLREDKDLFIRLLRGGASERIRLGNEVRALRTSTESISTSVDLPLSHSAKRVLAYAAEQAEHLGHKHIDTAHLLHGVIREPSLISGLLQQHHLDFENLQSEYASLPQNPQRLGPAPKMLQEQFRLLTSRLTPEVEPPLIYRLP